MKDIRNNNSRGQYNRGNNQRDNNRGHNSRENNRGRDRNNTDRNQRGGKHQKFGQKPEKKEEDPYALDAQELNHLADLRVKYRDRAKERLDGIDLVEENFSFLD